MLRSEMLESRARELAGRGAVDNTGVKSPVLVADWPDQSWAFELSVFHRLVESAVAPSPSGVSYRGLPCTGFLYYQSQVYPVVPWASLVALEQPEHPIYAVSVTLGMALEIAGPCRVEKLDLSALDEVRRPHCKGKLGDLFVATLERSP